MVLMREETLNTNASLLCKLVESTQGDALN